MKIVYTEEARRNLTEIANYLAQFYPSIAANVDERLRTVIARIESWPESAQAVPDHPGIRMAPLVRYPYNATTGSWIKLLKYYTSITRRDETHGLTTSNRTMLKINKGQQHESMIGPN